MRKLIIALLAATAIGATAFAQDATSGASESPSLPSTPGSSGPRRAMPGVYAFTTEKDALALAAAGRKVVYFFAQAGDEPSLAAWADIKARARTIPAGVAIVVVDYASATALKAEYGVAAPDSYVLIGKKGEKLRAWKGSKTLSALLAELAKAG